jgi:hypothetical protein
MGLILAKGRQEEQATALLDQLQFTAEAELTSQHVTIPAGRGRLVLRQTRGHNHCSYAGTGSKLALSFMVLSYNLDCKDDKTVVGGR